MSAKILVTHKGGFKDFVRALPAMSHLHMQHKNDDITLMTRKKLVDLANHTGYFNKIWEVTPPARFNPVARLLLAAQRRAFKFDKIYALDKEPETMPHPKAPAKNWCKSDVDYFGLPQNYALVFIGAASERQNWPATRFGTLAKKLVLDKIKPVLIGGFEDRERADRMAKICPEAINLTGQTNLVEIAAVASAAKFAIGHDTGVLALAAFSGCPVLVLYNEGRKIEAPNGDKVTVLQSDLACQSVGEVYDILAGQGYL